MRAVYTLLLLALASASSLAQNVNNNSAAGTSSNPEQLQNQEQQEHRVTPQTQRIQIEDGGSRVDELRVGGQTQQISVQPKTGAMPAYEVLSPDGTRSRSGSRNGAETNTAPRVWNVMKF